MFKKNNSITFFLKVSTFGTETYTWYERIFSHFWPLDHLNSSHPPKCRLAAVHPVVLWGAVWAAVLVSIVTAETDPEVSLSRAELCDELLYDLLLRLRFHAQQLPSVPPAGELCLCEVQPSPELREIGQLVTRLPFSCLAHTLTCIRTHIHLITCTNCTLNIPRMFSHMLQASAT